MPGRPGYVEYSGTVEATVAGQDWYGDPTSQDETGSVSGVAVIDATGTVRGADAGYVDPGYVDSGDPGESDSE